jgi:hypothetical protein
MVDGPWVVGGDVVGYKVENERQAALSECAARLRQACRSADIIVDPVVTDAIRRTHDILGGVVRQRI